MEFREGRVASRSRAHRRTCIAGCALALSTGCGARGAAVGESVDASVSALSAPTTTAFVEHAGAFVATRAAERQTVRVDAGGATLSRLGRPWSLGLRIARIGRAGSMRQVETNAPRADEAHVAIDRGEGVREWFVSDTRGLEHGVDLDARPAGAGPLVVEVATDGLVPALKATGSVQLRDRRGATVLRYEALAAKDANGRALPASMAVAEGRVALRIEDGGATYPIVVDPLVVGQEQAVLTASDGVSNDAFGVSVALGGTTAMVGAQNAAGSGAVYVFSQNGTAWTQHQKLLPPDGAVGDEFGFGIAIDGNTAIVGAPGTAGTPASQFGVAYIFSLTGGVWTQEVQIAPSGGASYSGFGGSVGISGTTVIVGSNSGQAYIFSQGGAAGGQEQVLQPSDAGGFFGSNVAIDGQTAIASGGPSSYVFTQTGTTWAQTAELATSDGASLFGVAIHGETALFGAPHATVGANEEQGAAYIFTANGSTPQQTKLVAREGAANDGFGASVALSGTTALIGTQQGGAAYVFTLSGTVWTEQAKLTGASASESNFGNSVALDDTIGLVGSFTADGNNGGAYVYVPAHTNGDPCTAATACISGACIDGVCCSTSSCDPCATCNGTTPGTCTPSARGAAPTTTCGGGYLCDGTNMTCPTTCSSTTDCAAGNTCDPTSGHCVAGATCSTDNTSSINKSGVSTSCSPFLCDTTGACKSTCATTADCASGFACAGTSCVASTGAGSKGGCAVTRAASERAGMGGACALLVALGTGLRRRRQRRPGAAPGA